MAVDKLQVDLKKEEAEFPQPPPYLLLSVWDYNNRGGGGFGTHTTYQSLRAIKGRITSDSNGASNTRYSTIKREKGHAAGYYRIYEWHNSDGWVFIMEIEDDSILKEHELYKGKAPTEKVAAPQDDIAAAIASIVGVGGQD